MKPCFVNISLLPSSPRGKLVSSWLPASSSSCHRLRPVSVVLAAYAQNNDDAELARRRLQDTFLDAFLRPASVRQFRAPLDLPFAVLLARSTYNAMDELDFVPTDRFQREFFLLRADEYEKYIKHTRVARQGDLTDPTYFDFISYAAFRTVTQEMFNRPQRAFEEQFDANGTKRLVLRDPDVTDASLPVRFRQLVGDKVLLGLTEQMQAAQKADKDTVRGWTLDQATDASSLFDALLQAMKGQGFALVIDSKVKVSDRSAPVLAQWEINAPATLWGEEYLRRRRALVNDFDVMVVEALFRKCGYYLIQGSYQNKRTDAGWRRELQFSKRAML